MIEKLTPGEANSPLWMVLKVRLERELATLRQKNDGKLSELQTERLRGRIAQIKVILALDNPAPDVEPDL